MIIVPRQIVQVNEQIVVAIQLPEFAVNHIEMFVAEIGHDLVDIFFLLQQLQNLKSNQILNNHSNSKITHLKSNLQQIRSP